MGYSVTTSGMTELTEMLGKMGEAARGVAAASLYEGAGVMADAVSKSAGSIDTAPFHYVTSGTRKPSPEEKALVESADMGIAKFHKTGVTVDTSVGMRNAGYGQLGSKTKPIPQIANAINSGTSFMAKQPFFRRAVSQARGATVAAIESGVMSRIENMTK